MTPLHTPLQLASISCFRDNGSPLPLQQPLGSQPPLPRSTGHPQLAVEKLRSFFLAKGHFNQHWLCSGEIEMLGQLPFLEGPQLERLEFILNRRQKLVARDGSFAIEFILKELLQELVETARNRANNEGIPPIYTLKIVGGAVYWILGKEYLQKIVSSLGGGLHEIFTDNELDSLFNVPPDLDLRIILPPETSHGELKACNAWTFNFLLKCWQKVSPGEASRQSLYAQGFQKLSCKLSAEGNRFAIVSFGNTVDLQAGTIPIVELIFAAQLRRRFLWRGDDLNLMIDQLFQPRQQRLCLIPRSDVGNGWSAFLHGCARIINTVDVKSQDDAGKMDVIIRRMKGGLVALRPLLEVAKDTANDAEELSCLQPQLLPELANEIIAILEAGGAEPFAICERALQNHYLGHPFALQSYALDLYDLLSGHGASSGLQEKFEVWYRSRASSITLTAQYKGNPLLKLLAAAGGHSLPLQHAFLSLMAFLYVDHPYTFQGSRLFFYRNGAGDLKMRIAMECRPVEVSLERSPLRSLKILVDLCNSTAGEIDLWREVFISFLEPLAMQPMADFDELGELFPLLIALTEQPHPFLQQVGFLFLGQGGYLASHCEGILPLINRAQTLIFCESSIGLRSQLFSYFEQRCQREACRSQLSPAMGTLEQLGSRLMDSQASIAELYWLWSYLLIQMPDDEYNHCGFESWQRGAKLFATHFLEPSRLALWFEVLLPKRRIWALQSFELALAEPSSPKIEWFGLFDKLCVAGNEGGPLSCSERERYAALAIGLLAKYGGNFSNDILNYLFWIVGLFDNQQSTAAASLLIFIVKRGEFASISNGQHWLWLLEAAVTQGKEAPLSLCISTFRLQLFAGQLQTADRHLIAQCLYTVFKSCDGAFFSHAWDFVDQMPQLWSYFAIPESALLLGAIGYHLANAVHKMVAARGRYVAARAKLCNLLLEIDRRCCRHWSEEQFDHQAVAFVHSLAASPNPNHYLEASLRLRELFASELPREPLQELAKIVVAQLAHFQAVELENKLMVELQALMMLLCTGNRAHDMQAQFFKVLASHTFGNFVSIALKLAATMINHTAAVRTELMPPAYQAIAPLFGTFIRKNLDCIHAFEIADLLFQEKAALFIKPVTLEELRAKLLILVLGQATSWSSLPDLPVEELGLFIEEQPATTYLSGPNPGASELDLVGQDFSNDNLDPSLRFAADFICTAQLLYLRYQHTVVDRSMRKKCYEKVVPLALELYAEKGYTQFFGQLFFQVTQQFATYSSKEILLDAYNRLAAQLKMMSTAAQVTFIDNFIYDFEPLQPLNGNGDGVSEIIAPQPLNGIPTIPASESWTFCDQLAHIVEVAVRLHTSEQSRQELLWQISYTSLHMLIDLFPDRYHRYTEFIVAFAAMEVAPGKPFARLHSTAVYHLGSMMAIAYRKGLEAEALSHSDQDQKSSRAGSRKGAGRSRKAPARSSKGVCVAPQGSSKELDEQLFLLSAAVKSPESRQLEGLRSQVDIDFINSRSQILEAGRKVQLIVDLIIRLLEGKSLCHLSQALSLTRRWQLEIARYQSALLEQIYTKLVKAVARNPMGDGALPPPVERLADVALLFNDKVLVLKVKVSALKTLSSNCMLCVLRILFDRVAKHYCADGKPLHYDLLFRLLEKTMQKGIFKDEIQQTLDYLNAIIPYALTQIENDEKSVIKDVRRLFCTAYGHYHNRCDDRLMSDAISGLFNVWLKNLMVLDREGVYLADAKEAFSEAIHTGLYQSEYLKLAASVLLQR